MVLRLFCDVFVFVFFPRVLSALYSACVFLLSLSPSLFRRCAKAVICYKSLRWGHHSHCASGPAFGRVCHLPSTLSHFFGVFLHAVSEPLSHPPFRPAPPCPSRPLSYTPSRVPFFVSLPPMSYTPPPISGPPPSLILCDTCLFPLLHPPLSSLVHHPPLHTLYPPLPLYCTASSPPLSPPPSHILYPTPLPSAAPPPRCLVSCGIGGARKPAARAGTACKGPRGRSGEIIFFISHMGYI